MAKVVALQGEITMEQKKNEELKEQLSLKETRMRCVHRMASANVMGRDICYEGMPV